MPDKLIGFTQASYPAFFALCAAAVFMALILRVIKNVFAQAEEIKKENDYTI